MYVSAGVFVCTEGLNLAHTNTYWDISLDENRLQFSKISFEFCLPCINDARNLAMNQDHKYINTPCMRLYNHLI